MRLQQTLSPADRAGHPRLPAALPAGVLLIAIAWPMAWAGPAPYSEHTFFPLWLGYILTIELPRAVIKMSRAVAAPDRTIGVAEGAVNAKSALSELAQALRWPAPRLGVLHCGCSHTRPRALMRAAINVRHSGDK